MDDLEASRLMAFTRVLEAQRLLRAMAPEELLPEDVRSIWKEAIDLTYQIAQRMGTPEDEKPDEPSVVPPPIYTARKRSRIDALDYLRANLVSEIEEIQRALKTAVGDRVALRPRVFSGMEAGVRIAKLENLIDNLSSLILRIRLDQRLKLD
jgi:hypothetical protein